MAEFWNLSENTIQHLLQLKDRPIQLKSYFKIYWNINQMSYG